MKKIIYITYVRNIGEKWKLDEVFSSMKELGKFYNLKSDFNTIRESFFKRYCGTEFLKIIKTEIQINK